MVRHFVEWLVPGLLTESYTEEIGHRDPEKLILNEKSFVFGFRFFDMNENRVKSNVSGFYYINGDVLTREEAIMLFPEEKILASNLRSNKIDFVVRTIFGQMVDFRKGDMVFMTNQMRKIG